MQLLARLMDRVLAARGERVTIVAATSGDTGGAAIEAFRGSQRVDAVVLFPHGRISDVQRRMMTTAAEPNVHAVAIEGTFDDCQALVKAMFNDLRLPRSHAAGRRQLHQLGPHRRPDRLLLRRRQRRSAPRSAPCRSRCRPATSATSSPATRPRRMGLPIERLVIATNENDILHRAWSTGMYDAAPTWSPPPRRRWTSRSPPTSSASCSRPSGRDAACVRGKMGGLRQSRLDSSLGDAIVPYRADFVAERVDEAAVADCIRRVKAEQRLSARPAHRLRRGRGAQDDDLAARHVPHIVLATAHPAKFPDAMQAITGERPALPPRLASLMSDPERITVLPNDLARRRSASSRSARRARARSRGMSTQTDPARQRPARRLPPHAARGDGVARRVGRRRRAPRAGGRARHLASARAHGLQGHRAAQRQRHRRGDRGGRRRAQCRHQPGDHRLLRARAARPTSASRSISWPTSCRSRATPQDELEREREVILQEIAATRDSPDEIAYELLQDAAFPDQAIGRPILGTAESVDELQRRRPAHLPQGQLRRQPHGAVGRRQRRPRRAGAPR